MNKHFQKWFSKKYKTHDEGVSNQSTSVDATTSTKDLPNVQNLEEEIPEIKHARYLFKAKVKDFVVERTLLRLLLLALILFLLPHIVYVIEPIKIFIGTLIMPFVISGILYYVTSPILRLGLSKTKLPKQVIILFIYLLIIGVIYLVISVLGPLLKMQIGEFMQQLPTLLKDMQEYILTMSKSDKFDFISNYIQLDTQDIVKTISEWINTSILHMTESIFSYVGKVSTFIIHLIVVPFMLYYMLKDGDKLIPALTKFLKKAYRKETTTILTEMNVQMKSYVLGQFIVYASVGLMVFVGYTLIGLDYAFLLAICFLVINFIPLLGIFIGAIPAVLVALVTSPLMAIKVIIVVTIAHQIDAHLISPQIMGKKLNIHPLTIIILLLVAGTFAGVLGLIFALPLYVALKVIITNLFRIYNLHKNRKKSEN